MTRDRVAYDANWAGRRFTLVDTGGWEPDAQGIQVRVAEQAEIAIATADAVLFVVDATVGPTDTDEAVVKVLRRAGKPVVLAANKVDDPRAEADAATLWSLGLGEPHPVSALHGGRQRRPAGRRLEAPPEGHGVATSEGGPRRVALLGRPNVGKSSLLNKVAGTERVVVDAVAGTTSTRSTSSSSSAARRGGSSTPPASAAGSTRGQGADYYASLRTEAALEKAEVAVVLVDASEPLTEQDLRIITMVVEAGRALVIAYNKWDLIDEERRYYLEREIERDLVKVQWAPRVNISALTGRHMDRLVPALERSLASWDTRIPTGRLNAFLGELVAGPPAPGAQRQAAAHPVRHPGGHPAAAVRAVHDRLPRGRLPAVHRAPAARGVRLRGHADRGQRAGAREARQR